MSITDEILQISQELRKDTLLLLQEHGKEEVLEQVDKVIKTVEENPKIPQAWKDFCIMIHRNSVEAAIKEYEHQ